jgi:arsenate reductase
MAEALLRKEAGEHFEAYSAGTDPKGMNPLTVQVMKELDIDISNQRSKHLYEYLGRLPVRVLIIVCGRREVMPYHLARRSPSSLLAVLRSGGG